MGIPEKMQPVQEVGVQVHMRLRDRLAKYSHQLQALHPTFIYAGMKRQDADEETSKSGWKLNVGRVQMLVQDSEVRRLPTKQCDLGNL